MKAWDKTPAEKRSRLPFGDSRDPDMGKNAPAFGENAESRGVFVSVKGVR